MTPQRELRIAMWSGPRNISTAMMRSWGSRPDTAVCDEPLYAHYLSVTGLEHPGRAEVVATHECDWRRVVAELCGPIPGGKSIYYQKHMAHHLLPEIERGWLDGFAQAFLIREPLEMLTSLVKNVPQPRVEDTGLPQQVELFEALRARVGVTPPVLDSRDVLENPRRRLGALCESLGVPFDEAMLSWPAGRRATDGVWAKHWYATVEASTGFEAYKPKNEPLPAELRGLCDECDRLYARLHAHRLT